GYRFAPNEASEPHCDEVKGTGRLGLESSKVCTMDPSLRWKRLISPQGTLQLPKSCVNFPEASPSDVSFCATLVRSAMLYHTDIQASFAGCEDTCQRASPQKTASDVGAESSAQR